MICSHPLAVARPDHEFAPVEAHLQASPKLAWLMRKLTDISRDGEKAIVFSEFREVQRLLQRAIQQQFGFRPQIINGSTSVDIGNDESRQGLIDRFQETPGFSVLVLSTSAVGFGVNIQAANHVIHFTRSWNPAKEDQATDRAYRIGQTKPVYVYTPTVCGDGFEAFDQRIRVLLESKRDLSRDMLAGVQEIGVEDFAGI
jgi:SNF2 family DNA or RNA helicase